ncbi:gamma-glutamyltransferase [Reticulomyxa filosa]|uniref:Gamma-glutamyltransferase n=1 Tax=Reticulomyxa filosa TaxID=46433 RepID=X6PE97_RETFI|nr:gamma-glutamyltransferase [Reticulomyxa filosa]|eukprot:ETO36007.1 gamma-glutamyltransferase [Reticulomyxa filosa]
MVSSEHYLATQAGIKVLENGGNAADAAVAVQMTLNVVEPAMSGIGGGCFIMYYDKALDTVYAIDGREEAPNLYHPQIFCANTTCFEQIVSRPNASDNSPVCDCFQANQTISTYENRAYGGLSNGVPGTLYAMHLLHQNLGSGVPLAEWPNLFVDAITAAENDYNATKALFFNEDGTVKAQVGQTFYNPDLGQTLRILGSNTSDFAVEYFYRGELAREIVDTTRASVNPTTQRYGLMSQDDLSNYRAVFRNPVVGTYLNEYLVFGMNMPSSGGVSLLQMLNYDEAMVTDSEYYVNESTANNSSFAEYVDDVVNGNMYHLDIYDANVIHTWITLLDLAFADRNHYEGDQDFITPGVPVQGLLNKTYARNRLRQFFSDQYVSVPIRYGTPPNWNATNNITDIPNVEHGTSHFVVLATPFPFFKQKSYKEDQKTNLCLLLPKKNKKKVVDKWGNIACITTTIENMFGSGVTVPNRGFLLNNECTDFDTLGVTSDGTFTANAPMGGKRQRKSALNAFGSEDSTSLGGKRPRSSMTPTLVFNASIYRQQNRLEPILAIGSPGGSTIFGTVWQGLSKILFWLFFLFFIFYLTILMTIIIIKY